MESKPFSISANHNTLLFLMAILGIQWNEKHKPCRQDRTYANWTNYSHLGPRWSYLFSAVQARTTTHCRFYREQLGPASPKAGHACRGLSQEHFLSCLLLNRSDVSEKMEMRKVIGRRWRGVKRWQYITWLLVIQIEFSFYLFFFVWFCY